MLSNLVESSISNFENESQGELEGLNALNTKQMISLDKKQRKQYKQQRRSGTSTDLNSNFNKLSKVAKTQPDVEEANDQPSKRAPVMKVDAIDKRAKDIDSDNNDALSNDELTVPVPIRGSYMSNKTKQEET